MGAVMSAVLHLCLGPWASVLVCWLLLCCCWECVWLWAGLGGMGGQ